MCCLCKNIRCTNIRARHTYLRCGPAHLSQGGRPLTLTTAVSAGVSQYPSHAPGGAHSSKHSQPLLPTSTSGCLGAAVRCLRIQAQGGCIHDMSSDEVARHPPSRPLAPSPTQPPLHPHCTSAARTSTKQHVNRLAATLIFNPCWTPHALLTTSSAQASYLLMTTYDTTHRRGGYYTVLAVTKHSGCAALCQPQRSAQAAHRRCAHEPITGSNMTSKDTHYVCTKATRRFPPNTLGDTASTNSSRMRHSQEPGKMCTYGLRWR
jgi:hypothetical protein